MKLDRERGAQRFRRAGMSCGLAVCAGIIVLGCGSASTKSASRPETPGSTVHLMAAEIRRAEDAPKVGKPQHEDSSVVDEEEGKKDPPQRHGEHKSGGGFSGYK